MTDKLMNDHPAYAALQEYAAQLGHKFDLNAAFAQQSDRAQNYSASVAGLFVDYSKNLINDQILTDLIALAKAQGFEEKRAGMYRGDILNETEKRAVLHVALRDVRPRKYMFQGEDVIPAITAQKQKMHQFCEDFHAKKLRGHDGQPLDTIVNFGVGGSDLGGVMVSQALRPYHLEGIKSYYVSNIDGNHITEILRRVDPARTLFIIASKSFTTEETMANAQTARQWFLDKTSQDESAIAKHFIALSTNLPAVKEFGIASENVFTFWDWVGGRFSLWSVIGLPIALQIGYDNFTDLLNGAHAMDVHFEEAPHDQNIPLLLALIGVWHRNFMGFSSHAILPYDQFMHRLPAYLQQLDMESNGKGTSVDGQKLPYETGPVIFGESGTNGQHAFYQLIHQGTEKVSADFIVAATPHHDLDDHHIKLLSNFLAQPEALMRGKSKAQVEAELETSDLSEAEKDFLGPHKYFPGNVPTTSIVMPKLTPFHLGALLALYEHKIFCQGVVWGVNSFDQWGVEYGKKLAKNIQPELKTLPENLDHHDASTAQLMRYISALRT